MLSPTETMAITDAIPMMIPSMVRKERILLDRMAWSAMVIFSSSMASLLSSF